MMAAQVIRAFSDRFTDKIYHPGDTYEGSDERISELANAGFLKIVKSGGKKQAASKTAAPKTAEPKTDAGGDEPAAGEKPETAAANKPAPKTQAAKKTTATKKAAAKSETTQKKDK